MRRPAAQAEADGLTVDRTCYPWVAYRGARFAPDHIEEVETERETHLRTQVTELQERGNRLLAQARGLRYQVDEFHEKFGHPRPRELVQEFDGALMRFRARLITEEYLEVIDAIYEGEKPSRTVRSKLYGLVEGAPIDIDLPALVDGLADLDYVVEGTRIAIGVDGRPIAAEVHRANMDKGANGPDGKPVKPEGWKPPDIEGELKKQGWRG